MCRSEGLWPLRPGHGGDCSFCIALLGIALGAPDATLRGHSSSPVEKSHREELRSPVDGQHSRHTCGQAPWKQMPQPQPSVEAPAKCCTEPREDIKPEPLNWVTALLTPRIHARYLLTMYHGVLRHKLQGWAALQPQRANTHNTPFIEQSSPPGNLRWHFPYTKFLYEWMWV